MLSVEATRIIVGILLLALGRRLFWLFVGGVGFVLGTRFADQFMHDQPDNVTVVFALIVGLVCAGLALVLKKIALGVAGFFVGGYLVWRLALFNGWEAATSLNQWIFFAAGGLVGSAFINTFFTWAIIALSAIGGAALVCESLHLSAQVSSMLCVGLATAGALFQLGVLSNPRKE